MARLPTATLFSFIVRLSLRIFHVFPFGAFLLISFLHIPSSLLICRRASLPDNSLIPIEKYLDSTMLRLFFYLLFSDFCYTLFLFATHQAVTIPLILSAQECFFGFKNNTLLPKNAGFFSFGKAALKTAMRGYTCRYASKPFSKQRTQKEKRQVLTYVS